MERTAEQKQHPMQGNVGAVYVVAAQSPAGKEQGPLGMEGGNTPDPTVLAGTAVERR